MKLSEAIARNPGLATVVGGALVVGFAWWFFRGKLGELGQAINPTSDQNLAYRGVNAVGSALTDDEDFSLGSWFYDNFGPGNIEAARIAAERKSPAERTFLENWLTKISGG